MLDSLSADSRPARGDCQDVPATRQNTASDGKFSPATRLALFLAGAALSWGLFIALAWLVYRAL